MDESIFNDLNDKINCQTSNQPFWLDDPGVLFKNNNYTRIMPRYEMSRNEQLNAIARFGIYAAVLVFMFGKNEYFLLISLGLIALTILVHRTKLLDGLWNSKVFQKIMGIRQEYKENLEQLQRLEYVHDAADSTKSYTELVDEARRAKRSDYIVKSGVYDSDNQLHLGEMEYPKGSIEAVDTKPEIYSINEQLAYEKNTCRRPTIHNPLMNTPVTDYGKPNIPSACNADDEEIKNEIVTSFNKDLFRDLDEMWDKENSQRQFYTVPNTLTPNNQVEFARFLYRIPTENICKEDQYACERYRDLRIRTL